MFPSPTPRRQQVILKGLARLACFTIAECWLNAVNLDTLADYHEFIHDQLMREISQQQRIASVINNTQASLS
jgi:hypothetical protein